MLYKFNSSRFLESHKANHVFFASVGDPPLMESETATHGSPGCLLRSRKFWGENENGFLKDYLRFCDCHSASF